MSAIKKHDLFDFLASITDEMATEYERIQRRALEDPGTAGDQGEENWAELLGDWLPQTYHVVTNGRILSHDGKASPQIDVLVLKASYPKKLLDKKLYLAGGVAAAFECKVTLRAAHIEKAISNSIKIKGLYPERHGSPYRELNSPIVYGLLGHSHCWKGQKSTPIMNIENKLNDEDQAQVKHPREMLDIVCVSDLASWTGSRGWAIGPKDTESPLPLDIYGKRGMIFTTYVGYTPRLTGQLEGFKPVGACISILSQKLAWENVGARSLADYFRITQISGRGRGTMREWQADVISNELKKKMVRFGLAYNDRWNEWSPFFP